MKIAPCKLSDLIEVKEISDQQFGVNYLTEEDLQYYFTSSNSHILIALDQKKVIGFSIFNTGNFESMLNEIGVEHYKTLKSLKKIESFHLHKTTAVSQEYFNQGVGSALLQNAFNTNTADCYLSLIWKRKINIQMHHIITKLGFHSLSEIGNYWSKSSLEKSYDCPECGEPPCTCSLIIMIK